MNYSERLVTAIKQAEGFTPVAKHLDGDRANVITGGYGETQVKLGQTFTEVSADARLRVRLDGFASAVRKLVKAPVSQGQFDALVDFAYNCGTEALRTSTLLRYLNDGLYSSAGLEFLVWNKADGKVLAGLTHRREIEKGWFEA